MIDFHSHVLPGLDDGSKSVDESIKMLSLLYQQGITKVVATPHFYANHNSVDVFIDNREKSYNKISQLLDADLPEVILGAEVKYYEGISRLDGLTKLCIGDSKLLLLEMPMSKWTPYTLREVRELSLSGKVIVVLAHIERYLNYQSWQTIEELLCDGVLIQVNAKYFIDFRTRRKALKMLDKGYINFIGSDCHNLTTRIPNMGEAISYIKRKSREDLINQINTLSERFI